MVGSLGRLHRVRKSALAGLYRLLYGTSDVLGLEGWDDLPRILEVFRAALTSRQQFEVEGRLRWRDAVFSPAAALRATNLEKLSNGSERIPILKTANAPRKPSKAHSLLVSSGVRQRHLVANPADHPTGLHVSRRIINRGAPVTALMDPVAFFLPEHAMDPSVRNAGEESWMEVTVPKTGPPRPIQLAIKQGDSFTPLCLR